MPGRILQVSSGKPQLLEVSLWALVLTPKISHVRSLCCLCINVIWSDALRITRDSSFCLKTQQSSDYLDVLPASATLILLRLPSPCVNPVHLGRIGGWASATTANKARAYMSTELQTLEHVFLTVGSNAFYSPFCYLISITNQHVYQGHILGITKLFVIISSVLFLAFETFSFHSSGLEPLGSLTCVSSWGGHLGCVSWGHLECKQLRAFRLDWNSNLLSIHLFQPAFQYLYKGFCRSCEPGGCLSLELVLISVVKFSSP